MEMFVRVITFFILATSISGCSGGIADSNVQDLFPDIPHEYNPSIGVSQNPSTNGMGIISHSESKLKTERLNDDFFLLPEVGEDRTSYYRVSYSDLTSTLLVIAKKHYRANGIIYFINAKLATGETERHIRYNVASNTITDNVLTNFYDIENLKYHSNKIVFYGYLKSTPETRRIYSMDNDGLNNQASISTQDSGNCNSTTFEVGAFGVFYNFKTTNYNYRLVDFDGTGGTNLVTDTPSCPGVRVSTDKTNLIYSYAKNLIVYNSSGSTTINTNNYNFEASNDFVAYKEVQNLGHYELRLYNISTDTEKTISNKTVTTTSFPLYEKDGNTFVYYLAEDEFGEGKGYIVKYDWNTETKQKILDVTDDINFIKELFASNEGGYLVFDYYQGTRANYLLNLDTMQVSQIPEDIELSDPFVSFTDELIEFENITYYIQTQELHPVASFGLENPLRSSKYQATYRQANGSNLMLEKRSIADQSLQATLKLNFISPTRDILITKNKDFIVSQSSDNTFYIHDLAKQETKKVEYDDFTIENLYVTTNDENDKSYVAIVGERIDNTSTDTELRLYNISESSTAFIDTNLDELPLFSENGRYITYIITLGSNTHPIRSFDLNTFTYIALANESTLWDDFLTLENKIYAAENEDLYIANFDGTEKIIVPTGLELGDNSKLKIVGDRYILQQKYTTGNLFSVKEDGSDRIVYGVNREIDGSLYIIFSDAVHYSSIYDRVTRKNHESSQLHLYSHTLDNSNTITIHDPASGHTGVDDVASTPNGKYLLVEADFDLAGQNELARMDFEGNGITQVGLTDNPPAGTDYQAITVTKDSLYAVYYSNERDLDHFDLYALDVEAGVSYVLHDPLPYGGCLVNDIQFNNENSLIGFRGDFQGLGRSNIKVHRFSDKKNAYLRPDGEKSQVGYFKFLSESQVLYQSNHNETDGFDIYITELEFN